MLRTLYVGIILIALLGLMVGCNKFLENPTEVAVNPNIAADVSANELIAGTTIQAHIFLNSRATRIALVWSQQMGGVGQHYSGFAQMQVANGDFNTPWWDVYGYGGLLDQNTLQAKAAEKGLWTHAGISKMWEALTMSKAADYWGDIPYSEAALFPEVPTPTYDKQSDVHDALLVLIDEAIEDLGKTPSSAFDGDYDFSFGGDIDKWIAAGHTLKARILLNWAEARSGNYALALAEAQQGVADADGNWICNFSAEAGHESLWWQYEQLRPGYIAAGHQLVEMLKADNDPRLELYFAPIGDGSYVGTRPDSIMTASLLNEDTYGGKGWDPENITWHENQFIIAECQYATGDEAGALTTLNDVIQPGLEVKWGLDANSLPRYPGLTGVDLLEAIMNEKYKAMFLDSQTWMDWRRTAFPKFYYAPFGGRTPRAHLYPQRELDTNPNTPTITDPLFHRVENNPGDPAYAAGWPGL